MEFTIARACIRKLVLAFLGATTDRYRKTSGEKKQKLEKPDLPFGAPHHSALGDIGEKAVIRSLKNDYPSIRDIYEWKSPDEEMKRTIADLDASEISSMVRVSSQEIKPQEPPTWDSFPQLDILSCLEMVDGTQPRPNERVTVEYRVVPFGTYVSDSDSAMAELIGRVALQIDKRFKGILLDPFDGLEISQERYSIKLDLTRFNLMRMYPQVHINSPALLLNGIVDYLAINDTDDIVSIEVKNTGRASGRDPFQLLAYMHALKFGGRAHLDYKSSLTTEAAITSAKRDRLGKLYSNMYMMARTVLEEFGIDYPESSVLSSKSVGSSEVGQELHKISQHTGRRVRYIKVKLRKSSLET